MSKQFEPGKRYVFSLEEYCAATGTDEDNYNTEGWHVRCDGKGVMLIDENMGEVRDNAVSANWCRELSNAITFESGKKYAFRRKYFLMTHYNRWLYKVNKRMQQIADEADGKIVTVVDENWASVTRDLNVPPAWCEEVPNA